VKNKTVFEILLLKSNKCTLLVTSTLNKIKVTIKTPTRFGSRRNHYQGVPHSNVHLMDFNERILILKMHGANIKITVFELLTVCYILYNIFSDFF
jgi:hypothetical protein